MKIINLSHVPRLISPCQNTKFSKLLVSGCSFTSLNFGQHDLYATILRECYQRIKDRSWPEIQTTSDWCEVSQQIKQECQQHGMDWQHLTYVTWPIYLRDLLGLDDIIDCSCSGAGNKHIHNSVIWTLETQPQYTPDNTLVIVMWSGFTREDLIAAPECIRADSTMQYQYREDARLLSTGSIPGKGNGFYDLSVIHKVKTDATRSVENFIYISGLYHYLRSKGFCFLFARYSTAMQETQMDITRFLTPDQTELFHSMIEVNPALGDFAEETGDGSHPTPRWHHAWAREILLPTIQRKYA